MKQTLANIQGVYKNDAGIHFGRIPYKKYVNIFCQTKKLSQMLSKNCQNKIFVAKCFQNSPDFWYLAINSPIWQPCATLQATNTNGLFQA